MDTALLRQSFERIIEREPAIVGRFYEILFERYPAARTMFRGKSLVAQEKMLAAALGGVLDHLEDAAWLTTTLEALGARHVQYGVSDHMYDWVGECLLAALAEVAGSDWSEPLAAAWTEAYGFIATTMKRGSARARAASAA